MSENKKMTAHILVVDDDPIVADSLAMYVRTLGHEVATAGDGAEALGMLRSASKPFHLVISDVNMPRMDGVAFVRTVRKRDVRKGVPVMMVTAEPRARWRSRRSRPAPTATS